MSQLMTLFVVMFVAFHVVLGLIALAWRTARWAVGRVLWWRRMRMLRRSERAWPRRRSQAGATVIA